ncbi:hypothetical protein J132_04517 [Termitomyces sp. J132]|nr:hypothetical protein J132_04517 [Termitomyces sp. J132]
MEWLPFAEFAYKNRVHSAIGMSPFYTEYAYNPTFSIDPVNSQSVLKAHACLDRIREVQGELKGLLELAAERMKRFYDAWVDESPDGKENKGMSEFLVRWRGYDERTNG